MNLKELKVKVLQSINDDIKYDSKLKKVSIDYINNIFDDELIMMSNTRNLNLISTHHFNKERYFMFIESASNIEVRYKIYTDKVEKILLIDNEYKGTYITPLSEK